MPPKESKKSSPISLKEAREQGKLEQFIKEHENDAPGDAEKLDDMLRTKIPKNDDIQKPAKKNTNK